MFDVFISYVHGQSIAEIMSKTLEAKGLTTFIDSKLSMGSPLVSSINQALKESRSYLLIIDEKFTTSDWTNTETQVAIMAAMRDKKVFPLLIDEKAKEFWVHENPLYANYLGRTWVESTPDTLAEEIKSILIE